MRCGFCEQEFISDVKVKVYCTEACRHKAETRRDRRRKRAYVSAHKEARACVDCGVRYPAVVMDLDHRDPSTKVFGVSRMVNTFGLEKIKAELLKCDVVCANCHRLRTYT